MDDVLRCDPPLARRLPLPRLLSGPLLAVLPTRRCERKGGARALNATETEPEPEAAAAAEAVVSEERSGSTKASGLEPGLARAWTSGVGEGES